MCEVQGYAYAAWQNGAATLVRHYGLPEQSKNLQMQAELLRERFENAFWIDELSTYAVALMGTSALAVCGRPTPDNVCFSGIVLPERAGR